MGKRRLRELAHFRRIPRIRSRLSRYNREGYRYRRASDTFRRGFRLDDSAERITYAFSARPLFARSSRDLARYELSEATNRASALANATRTAVETFTRRAIRLRVCVATIFTVSYEIIVDEFICLCAKRFEPHPPSVLLPSPPRHALRASATSVRVVGFHMQSLPTLYRVSYRVDEKKIYPRYRPRARSMMLYKRRDIKVIHKTCRQKVHLLNVKYRNTYFPKVSTRMFNRRVYTVLTRRAGVSLEILSNTYRACHT